MGIDRDQLGKWAGRKVRSSASPAAPEPARQPAAASLPAPPPGYTYAFHGGVPMLVPLPAGMPDAPVMSFPSHPNVVPIRPRTRNAKLVRPLSKDGVVIPDPWDAALANLPDLAPAPQTAAYFEAFATEPEAPVQAQHQAMDNPFGRAPLQFGSSDLKK